MNKICSECEHAAFGQSGVWCTMFAEEVATEQVAEECPEYVPVPWAQQRKGVTQ